MGLKLRCIRCGSTRLRRYSKGSFVKDGIPVCRCFDCNRFITVPDAVEAATASRDGGSSDATPSVSDASSSLPSTPRAATPALPAEPTSPAKGKAKKRGSKPQQRR